MHLTDLYLFNTKYTTRYINLLRSRNIHENVISIITTMLNRDNRRSSH